MICRRSSLQRDEPNKPGERSHKLLPAVTGPVELVEDKDRTVVLRIGDSLKDVGKDRVTSATQPLPPPLPQTEAPPEEEVGGLTELRGVFTGAHPGPRMVLTHEMVEEALASAPRTTADFLIQESTPTGESNGENTATRVNPTFDGKPYEIIDRIVDHGEPDEGMPDLPRGTHVWRALCNGKENTVY